MADDYSAGSLYELWSPMIEGAVNADARIHGLTPIEYGVWYEPYTSTWIDMFGFTSSYTSPRQYQGSLMGFDPKKSSMEWSTRIPKLWTGWDVLPDPQYLGTNSDGELGAIYSVISKLAMNPDQRDYDVDAGDPDFASLMKVCETEIGSMDGAAMIAFNHEIASRLAYTSRVNAELAAVMAFAVQAEKAVWKTARTNLMATARQAVQAFQDGYPGGHGGGGAPGWLSMVGAITGALSLVVTGGTSAAVIGAVGTAAGSLGTFMDAGASDVSPTPMDADSPDAVCAKVTKALGDLNDSIRQGEHAIAHGCSSMRAKAGAPGAGYDLTRPSALDNDDARDFLKVDVEYDKLIDIATVTLPGIAEGFKDARTKLGGALGPTPWDRPAGFGSNPYGDYAGLVGEMDQLLADIVWKVHRSAEHMDWVIKDFKKTDAWVAQAHQDLLHDTRTVDTGSVTPSGRAR